jgi:hypothetical protein
MMMRMMMRMRMMMMMMVMVMMRMMRMMRMMMMVMMMMMMTRRPITHRLKQRLLPVQPPMPRDQAQARQPHRHAPLVISILVVLLWRILTQTIW